MHPRVEALRSEEPQRPTLRPSALAPPSGEGWLGRLGARLGSLYRGSSRPSPLGGELSPRTLERLLSEIYGRGPPRDGPALAGIAQAESRGVDRENVMCSRRIDRTRRAVAALMADQGPTCLDPLTTRGILAELDDLERSGERLGAPRAQPEGRALESTAFDRARRTLLGESRPGDMSESLESGRARFSLDSARTVDLGGLCARIWDRIQRYEAGSPAETRRERRLLRGSLVRALAECIEEDGHRVCSVGIAQRLCSVLQGYFEDVHIDALQPTPRELLSALAMAWQGRLEREDPSTHALLRDEAMARAREIFEPGSPDLSAFRAEVDAYLSLAGSPT